MNSDARGFTIIEVLLFLAISGLLLAVAIASVNLNIDNSRFNDAVRSTTSYLQKAYSEVSSGLSDRDASRGCDASGNITSSPTAVGMTNCVIMGRFIKLEGANFTSRYIVGSRATLVGLSADDSTAILQMSPKVVGTNVYEGNYGIPWNIQAVNTTLPSGTFGSAGLAIIRSPASGEILYYTQGNVTATEPTLDRSFIRDANLNKHVVVCFTDGGSRFGRINVGDGQGQEIIQTDLGNNGSCP